MNEISTAKVAAASRPSWQRVVRSAYDFDTTVARLKEAVAAADLWIVGEIDPQMLLRKAGYAIDATRQLLFFHPRYMVRLLARDPAALPEAPLKFVVMETNDENGAEVVVRHSDPVVAFEGYEGLDELGRELSTLCQSMLRNVE